MRRNYKYLLGLTPGLIVLVSNYLGGWWVIGNTLFSFVFLALLEKLFPENKNNAHEENKSFPDVVLYLNVTLQLLCMYSVVYTLQRYDYSYIQLLLLALSVGINTGSSAIVVAHELIHRKNKFNQFFGKLLLLTAGNIYFFVDHLRIHHKWVGTQKDHATARYGENIYSFFIRSVAGQISGSWKLETERLKAHNIISKIFNNYLIASCLLLIAITTGFYFLLGWNGVIVFLIQGFFANFLLEYINYIEHYGLTRNDNERVTEIHSWQSDKVISRFFLIDLSRHADHHYYASKPYHTLKSYEKAPLLPGGYVQMIYYALLPPLWFSAVHKVLDNKAK
jgi:alkane 1-monooxygenase